MIQTARLHDVDAGPTGGKALTSLAFTADELATSPAPSRVWQVKNMIPAKAVTLLQADGGMGKSVLGLQLMVATVLGKPWLGQEVRRGNALYFSCEDDRDEIHRRLDAITLDYGVALNDLPALKVLDMTGQDLVLASADRQGRLAPTERWSELEQVIAAWEPALIVIDNLADVFAGEENSRPQARQFVSLLQGAAARHNAALLLIGHPSLAGIASGTGSSGSTAWNNSVRSRLYMTRPSDDDTGPTDARVLAVKKSNYAASGVEIRLRWRAGAFVVEDGQEPLGAVDTHLAEERADRLFLELLNRLEAQGRAVSATPGHGYAPAAFAKEQGAEGIKAKGFDAAMRRLFTANLIRVVEVGPPSRRTKRIARTTG